MDITVEDKNGEHPFGDAGQMVSLGLFLVVWVADSFFLQGSTLLAGFVPLYVRLSVLGAAFVAAVYLARSGHMVVPRHGRTEVLVTSGAFRFVRHPLYLASLLVYLGLAISTLSLASLVVLVPIFLFHNYIAGFEDAILTIKFGEAYREYQQRTGKWIPRIKMPDLGSPFGINL
jgi:protein-S-isoprenylcysteine O-methyltransferase Ste14